MHLSVHHIISGLMLCFTLQSVSQAETMESLLGLDNTMKIIGEFEGQKDPKCYATASRLEDFMYGTPLSDSARFAKIQLQKEFVRKIWGRASRVADKQGTPEVSEADTRQVLGQFFKIHRDTDGNLVLRLPKRDAVPLKYTDYRQYSSIAYGLRAVLGAQQDALLQGATFLPLDDGAISALKEALDIITLATLSRADRKARISDQHSISTKNLNEEWQILTGHLGTAPESLTNPSIASQYKSERMPYATLKKIIAKKTASYETYNKISTAVFLRNIQVYFAKHRWTTDPQSSKRLKILFNETMIAFASDLIMGSEQTAHKVGHKLIRVEDVDHFIWEGPGW